MAMVDAPMMQCTARVRLTIEVSFLQPWDPNSSLADVEKAAKKEAIQFLGKAHMSDPSVRVVSEPKFVLVLAEKAQ